MKLSEPLRLGSKSIPITESCRAPASGRTRAIKAEYLARKRAKAAPEAPTLKEAIDAYIKAHSNTLSPLTIRGYRTRRKAQNKNATSTRNVPVMIPELATAIQRDRKPAGTLSWTLPRTVCGAPSRRSAGSMTFRTWAFTACATASPPWPTTYRCRSASPWRSAAGPMPPPCTRSTPISPARMSNDIRLPWTAFYAGKAPEKPQSENH